MLTGILAKEAERALARGDKQVGAFTGALRSMDSSALAVGDEFQIPNDFTGRIFQAPFGANGADYLLIESKAGKAIQLFPSVFTKSRTLYNNDMTPTKTRVATKGTAVEYVRQNFTDINAAMDALKGKTLKVTAIQPCKTLAFNRPTLVEAQLPVIDFVNDKGEVVDFDGKKVNA